MELSIENKNRLLKSNQCYMVGVLAEDEPYYPSGVEQECVTTFKNSSNLIFFIKPLSTDPEPISELEELRNPLYIGIDNDQNSWLIPSLYNSTHDIKQRKEMLYNKLKGKLIIFKPHIKFSTSQESGRADIPHKNAVVITVETEISLDKDVEFIPIPMIDITNNEFQKKIIEGSNIRLKDYGHQMFPPEHIMCNNYIYFNFPEWKKSTDECGWICEVSTKVKRIKINIENSEMDGKIIEVSGVDIIFIEKKALFTLEVNEKVENLTDPIIDEMNINDINEDVPTDEVDDTTKTDIDIKESNFINGFKKYTLSYNLCYSITDLINLHTCVKTNPLTILAGMSGTGKSELANAYAKMLKATEQFNTLLFLPISPSYTEPGDILGFLNNTTGLFVPSETGLVEFLLHARDNPKSMHVAVFDEMNLSQVEYWFSPFISLLERKPEDRMLLLYNAKSYCINKLSYPPSITISDNVKFIGTVNLDETTKDFSDRLLDRANFINLKKEDLSRFQKEVKEINPNNTEYKDSICNSYEEYESWIIKENWANAYTDEEIEFLDILHNKLNKVDEQKGVSFRIAKKMGEYLLNIPVNPDGTDMISKREAFDLQIKQRLVTKIKGTEKKYGKLIGTTKNNDSTELTNSDLFDYFSSEEALKISDFEVTKKEIVRKAKELGAYGYAN